jgi:hypothetical protein
MEDTPRGDGWGSETRPDDEWVRQDAVAGRGKPLPYKDHEENRIRLAAHFCTNPSLTFLNNLDESDASKSRRHASNVR